jgi:hypothetical protein
MKKSLISLIIIVLSATYIFAQTSKGSVEVLYFKANLACCKAKACNALESDIQRIITTNYPTGNVIFKEIRLADEANKSLVEKYTARSQTVILIYKGKKKEKYFEVSDIVQNYNMNKDPVVFEKQLKEKIAEVQKSK